MPTRVVPAEIARFITRSDLCSRWRISRATSYRMQREGYLRPPVKLGPGVARWSLLEIEAIEARAAEDRGASASSGIRGTEPR
jgi:predicted DNA-binding transcriptional regulator AlpA